MKMLPSVLTAVGVPAEQRLVVGAVLKVPPLAEPHAPFVEEIPDELLVELDAVPEELEAAPEPEPVEAPPELALIVPELLEPVTPPELELEIEPPLELAVMPELEEEVTPELLLLVPLPEPAVTPELDVVPELDVELEAGPELELALTMPVPDEPTLEVDPDELVELPLGCGCSIC